MSEIFLECEGTLPDAPECADLVLAIRALGKNPSRAHELFPMSRFAAALSGGASHWSVEAVDVRAGGRLYIEALAGTKTGYDTYRVMVKLLDELRVTNILAVTFHSGCGHYEAWTVRDGEVEMLYETDDYETVGDSPLDSIRALLARDEQGRWLPRESEDMNSEPGIEEVVNLLASPHSNNRGYAAYCLQGLLEDESPITLNVVSDEALQQVCSGLSDSDAEVRWAVATVLGCAGPHAAFCTDALLRALEDPEPNVRTGAASALGRIGLASEAVIEALVRTLTANEAWVRAAAADALGDLGPQARRAAPALEARLTDYYTVSDAAKRALAAITGR